MSMHSTPRIALVDIARTVALCAMAVFHFAYDLEMFGFAPHEMMQRPEWIWFARVIAGSFIFLSGVSLVLGAPQDTRKFFKRLVMIGAAAAMVSFGTYIAMGSAFVRFGILHLLLGSSLLGVVFLRSPFWINGLLGVVVLALPLLPFWPFLPSTGWLWLGATVEPLPLMVDYVPILPWFGMFLLGMGTAGWMQHLGLWSVLENYPSADARWARLLAWPGQHSLAIYLIHQPVLFGLVMLARMAL